MRVTCKRILQALLCFALLCCFAVCPTFLTYGSAADNYNQSLDVNSWWNRNEMNAYISSSTSFKTYSYGDPNFDCWLGTPQYQFYPNDSGFTRSDVVYGFRLSNFLNFDSSSASFTYSFDIPAFNFASVDKRT